METEGTPDNLLRQKASNNRLFTAPTSLLAVLSLKSPSSNLFSGPSY